MWISDRIIKIWDCDNNFQELYTLRDHTSIVDSVCFSIDGNILVSGSWDYTIKIWDCNARFQEINTLRCDRFIESICFSNDGSKIIAGLRGKTIRIWDTGTFQEINTLTVHNGDIYSLSIQPEQFEYLLK